VQWWQVVLVVGVVLVGGFVLSGARKAARMRRSNIEALLSKHGWSRVPEDPTLVDRWRGEPFGQGANPRATNVISGTYRGHGVLAFDYSYERRSPSGGVVRDVYAIFAVRLPRALPHVELTPEGLADRGRRLIGRGDVTVGDEEFDQAFRIRCDDARGAAALLQPELRRRLLEAGKRSYRFTGDTLLTWEFGPVDKYALNATWVEQAFDVLVGLGEAVPPDVP
jgi:hypothetical protein